MKIVAKEGFYLHGLFRLLERMRLEYNERGIWITEQRFVPFFIFPENSAWAIYKKSCEMSISSPALVFCSENTRDFLQDVLFSEEIYFVLLSDDCDTVKQKIKVAVEKMLNPTARRMEIACPYLRLCCNEVNVIRYLLKGYKPCMISGFLDMTIRQVSLYKRTAMRKLHVRSIPELYFKVKLLDRAL